MKAQNGAVNGAILEMDVIFLPQMSALPACYWPKWF